MLVPPPTLPDPIWKCSSPRGDGNPLQTLLRKGVIIFGNVVPREGTETQALDSAGLGAQNLEM